MAHGYLNAFGNEWLEVYSAGIETHGVNPRAIAVMKEDGIDISRHTSNNIAEYRNVMFDFVLTVCDHAKESCPYVPAMVKSLHQNFPDPAKAKGPEESVVEAFRQVRDSIRQYTLDFVSDHVKVFN
jgi:arsenate reductase